MTLSATWLRAPATIARTYGTRGLVLRSIHEARTRTGRFLAAPCHTPHTSVSANTAFRVSPAALQRAVPRAAALERAERVRRGSYEAFRWDWRPLPATPAAWLTQPDTGMLHAAATPWWRVAHLDPKAGDIKLLWEPARFGWVYDLVRGYVLTGDSAYVEAFVHYFDTWRAAAEPFSGVHWADGQEAAIRAVALLYAEAAFRTSPPYDGDVARAVEVVLGATGERIRDAIGCAISQRNNHGISESVGLIALGDRFEGHHPDAADWLATGRRLLFRLIEEQFAPDGWYIQHSLTYLRLSLDQCVVASRVLTSRGGFPPAARERLVAAGRLLASVSDPATGEVPNHGPNDGAFVHPITTAPYRDFRAVLTAVGAVFGMPWPRSVRLDEEVLAWLGLDAPPADDAPLPAVQSGASGWATVRQGRVAVFLRAGKYVSRPGHLDALHLDVRIDGREVIVDPGTYSYNAAPPWDNGLVHARVHNTPVIDDVEPAVRGSRFLWYTWPRARLVECRSDGERVVIAAELQTVRRTVVVEADRVMIHDHVRTRRKAHLSICWLLHPDAPTALVTTTVASRVGAAREGDTLGWFSPNYGLRIPSRYLAAEGWIAPGETVITTVTAPPESGHTQA